MSGKREPTCTVVLCHGCCCGTLRKHGDVDSAEHRRRVRAEVGPDVRVKVVGCLDLCARSNVAVVLPGRASRRRGAHPVWLGELLTDDAVDALIEWARTGGPGNAPLPDGLLDLRFRPARRSTPTIA